MFESIKSLPEKTRKRVVIILWITFLVLIVLAFIGVEIAREPLPEMIIAPNADYSTSIGEEV